MNNKMNYLNNSYKNYNHSYHSHSHHHHHHHHQHDTQILSLSSSNATTNSSSSKRIFGVDLRQLELINVNVNEQIVIVPSFLKHAIEYINGFTNVEGIFRRNGTASRLKELKKQVEEGVYNFSQFSIFDLTSLVKLFFRELPESLLTFQLYSNFVQAVKVETTKSKLETLLNLCLQLPEMNLNVLIYLMNFLKKITNQESDNKMNSFNLAVCFAPNIIYTRITKMNDSYINEERIVVQLLIENSSLIGKLGAGADYDRSVMLTSMCCSTTLNSNCTNSLCTTSNSSCCCAATNNTTGGVNSNGSSTVPSVGGSSSAGAKLSNTNLKNITNVTTSQSSAANADMLFIYDNDLQENSSFAHHAQSVGSTSITSYCGSSSSSSNSKKEKKKRRSSSLKELMNTIQNSISKLRRRSASEKNDKTTCSIITCSSMNSAASMSTNCAISLGDTTSCSSSHRFDDNKQKFLHNLHDTPYNSKYILSSATPICANLYATPRINKRNAEESLQSTTKKKLMEKLPQKSLLLPNAPITPFSTAKKNKHPLKQLLSASETGSGVGNSSASANTTTTSSTGVVGPGVSVAPGASTTLPVVSSSSSSNGMNAPSSALNNTTTVANNVSSNTTGVKVNDQNILSGKPPPTPTSNQLPSQTPQTIQKQPNPVTVNGNVNLPKQLKYEDSPMNHHFEAGSLKIRYTNTIEKSQSLMNDLNHDCRRRLDMLHPMSSKHQLSSSSSTTSSSSSSSKHHNHNHNHHHHHHHNHHHHGTNSSSSASNGHHYHHGLSSGGSSSSSHHHHHHNHAHGHHSHTHHQHSKHTPKDMYAYHQSSKHLYVNAIPSSSGAMLPAADSINTNTESNLGQHTCLSNSSTSSSSSSSSSSTSSGSSGSSSSICLPHRHNHNHTLACCTSKATNATICTSTIQQKAAIERSNLTNAGDNSMRCTLRRGRPNTPKTGLSIEYRIRKSSVPNTPECKHIPVSTRINNTISNDDLLTTSKPKTTSANQKNRLLANSVSSSSLNTAMVLNDDDENADKLSIITTTSVAKLDRDVDDLNEDARLLDMAFNGDEEIDDGDDDDDCDEENVNEQQINEHDMSSRSSSSEEEDEDDDDEDSVQGKQQQGKQLSLSLSNLPYESNGNGNDFANTTSASDSQGGAAMFAKSLSEEVLTELDKNKKFNFHNLLAGELLAETTETSDETTTTTCATDSLSATNLTTHITESTHIAVVTNTANNLKLGTSEPLVPKILVHPVIEQQQKLIQFEPFEFKSEENNFEQIFTNDQATAARSLNDDSTDSSLQAALRRQSLFKLRDKINGKVSRHVNEIEKRKLSPYRFSHSPLRQLKKYKEANGGTSTGHIAKHHHHHTSPGRTMTSTLCRKLLTDTPTDHFVIKGLPEDDEPTTSLTRPESTLIARAASSFYRKLNRSRSVKRLNSTQATSSSVGSSSNTSSMASGFSNLSSISENVSTNEQTRLDETATLSHDNTTIDRSSKFNSSRCQNNSTSSPTGKHLILSTELTCSTDSIDL